MTDAAGTPSVRFNAARGRNEWLVPHLDVWLVPYLEAALGRPLNLDLSDNLELELSDKSNGSADM